MLFLSLALPLTAASPPVDQAGVDQVINACIAGDRRAQETFYRDHYGMLLTVCRRYASDEQLAADYTNQAFLRAFTHLGSLKDGATLGVWLRRIAINVCLTELRKLDKRTTELKEIDLPAGARIQPKAFEKMGVEEIIRLLQRLPQRQRLVFNLVAVEGYRHADVAKQLGITAANCRYHFACARIALQCLILHQNQLPDEK
jgi:RNA polymerase sigma-70 factor (ECF subfamily)